MQRLKEKLDISFPMIELKQIEFERFQRLKIDQHFFYEVAENENN